MTFCEPILLWVVRDASLVDDALLVCPRGHYLVEELSPIVSSEDSDGELLEVTSLVSPANNLKWYV